MPQLTARLRTPWGASAALWGEPLTTPWGLAAALWSTGGAYTPPPPPAGGTPVAPTTAAAITVPAAAVYDLVHTLQVTDLRSNTALPVASVSISTDRDSAFWVLRATGAPELLGLLAAGEQPARVRVAIDGAEWDFVVEAVTRARRHVATEVAVEGRSLSAAAGSPYQGERLWSLEGDTTGAQLAAAANLFTELEVQFELDDWPVPAGVFSFTGTPLGVVQRVAEAAGGMVISRRTGYGVIVRPRYAVLPNEWSTTAPELELPLDVLDSESFRVADQPPYDGVVVSGQQQGAVGLVRLAGTSGGFQAPMVTDPLLTDVIALRQRGQAVLGQGGKQQVHTLSLPVVSVAGTAVVPDPGWLVRVPDTPAWVGLVTGVQLEAELGRALLTLTLERHTAVIEGTVATPPITNVLQFSGSIPNVQVAPGAAVNVPLAAYWVNGVSPRAYSLRAGALPAWLTLNSSTGELVGTAPASPQTIGPLAVRATDSINSTADSNEFTVGVVSAAAPLFLLSADESQPHLRSNDNGLTWAPVAGLGASRLYDLRKAGSRYVATGGTGWEANGVVAGTPPFGSFVWHSVDGASWTAVSDALVNQSSGASFYPGYNGAAGRPDGRVLICNYTPSSSARAYFSDDGATWALSSATTNYRAHYSQVLGLWVLLGFNVVRTSVTAADGSWTDRTTGTGTWGFIAEGGGRMVIAQGAANVPPPLPPPLPVPVAVSTDGLTWTRTAAALPVRSTGLAFGAGRFVSALLGTQVVASSVNGSAWTLGTGIPVGASLGLSPIWTGSEFLLIVVPSAGATTHHLYASADGIAWSLRAVLPVGLGYRNIRAPDATP